MDTYKDLAEVRQRVRQKRQDYIDYDFTSKKNDTLKTFFDLAQEYILLDDFYRICVVILHEYFNVESKLYLEIPDSVDFMLVCDSLDGVSDCPVKSPDYIKTISGEYKKQDSFLVPIYCKGSLAVRSTDHCTLHQIGVLEVFPASSLTEADKFFLEKYSNRIGYNLKNKVLGQENIRHLKFINNLVSDIEHNVIIPNMHFKYLFNQLQKQIADVDRLKDLVSRSVENVQEPKADCHDIVIDKISTIQAGLHAAFMEIENHHENYTLFLESLFRRDHFERGRFVLRNKIINVDREIIRPQFAYYKSRFVARGIKIHHPKDFHDEDYSIVADLGLLSQVYANLFSNAVKYTAPIVDHTGCKRKSLAYGRKLLRDHYGPNRPGIKLNVFTTGPHLPSQEINNIFRDGFQGENKSGVHSRGHGLAFVKYVVELHGGTVAHESTEQGNNFYFILPLVENK